MRVLRSDGRQPRQENLGALRGNKRASVFVGLWLHLRRGVPTDAAFALQRNFWQPDAGWARLMADALAPQRGRNLQSATVPA